MEDASRSSSSFDSHDHRAFSRIDIVRGPTGRRNWPDEVKGALVAESYRSDLSVSEFARRNDLAPSQLFGWRRAAKNGKFALPVDHCEAFFTPLVLEAPSAGSDVDPDPAESGASHQIELAFGAVVIRLPGDTPPARIAEIARALA